MTEQELKNECKTIPTNHVLFLNRLVRDRGPSILHTILQSRPDLLSVLLRSQEQMQLDSTNSRHVRNFYLCMTDDETENGRIYEAKLTALGCLAENVLTTADLLKLSPEGLRDSIQHLEFIQQIINKKVLEAKNVQKNQLRLLAILEVPGPVHEKQHAGRYYRDQRHKKALDYVLKIKVILLKRCVPQRPMKGFTVEVEG